MSTLSQPRVPVIPDAEIPYARRRLRLGITGVGSSVVLAVVWLLLLASGAVSLSAEWRPLGLALGGPAAAVVAALLVFAVHALLLLPAEFLGGTRVRRERVATSPWLAAWSRGVLVQGVIVASAAASSFALATLLGRLAYPMVAALGALLLLAAQGNLARALAPLRLRRPDEDTAAFAAAHGLSADRLHVVAADDEAFVGGWLGLRQPQLWVPQRWTLPQHRQLLAVQLVRRIVQERSGARRRGITRGLVWQLLGASLIAALLPWSLTEARSYLVLPALATLWGFLGVLLLPTLSRGAVYEADREAAAALGVGAVARAVEQLDRWQDDEAERSPWVERVFHPVPSRGNRQRALQGETPPHPPGGHQLTRLMLYVSLAGLGLLGRVVHCNVGRPELWAVYPGD